MVMQITAEIMNDANLFNIIVLTYETVNLLSKFCSCFEQSVQFIGQFCEPVKDAQLNLYQFDHLIN